MKAAQVKELLLQSLEHEQGGVLVYRQALACVVNRDLRREWTKYLQQTEQHVARLSIACEALGIDPGERTPGCLVVRQVGAALVNAMKQALGEGDRVAAELVACECVVLAETKDHADWELIGQCVQTMSGEETEPLRAAYAETEEEEDEHLYHSKGWCRELWLKALGLPAQLPPPEEKRDVKSAAEAEQAKKSAQRRR